MQTRRSCKQSKDGEHISAPKNPAVAQQAVCKVSPEEREQIRMRAHEIADSLHAAGNALKNDVYDNPAALLWLLQCPKVPFAIVSLSDRVLTCLYNTSQDGAVGPIPAATYEEILAAEIAPMCVDGMLPCDQSHLHFAPCDTPRRLSDDINEDEGQNSILGDAATVKCSRDSAIGCAEDNGGYQEVMTDFPCPNAQEENHDTKKRQGRPPLVDDRVAYAVLMKVVSDSELSLEAAVARVNATWETQIERGSGRSLCRKRNRVLNTSTLRKRLPVVTGCVWTDLKKEENKKNVKNKIRDSFPAVYRNYMSSVGQEEEVDAEEEEQEEQADNAYGDVATIKKEDTWPTPTFQHHQQQQQQQDEHATEDQKNNFGPTWDENGAEEPEELLLPIKQEPHQDDNHDFYHGFHSAGCDSYDELMMNSSPLMSPL